MIEKTSEDVKCRVCGKPAITEIAGIPVCSSCVDAPEVKEAQKMIENFED
jgi:hypothetical protein